MSAGENENPLPSDSVDFIGPFEHYDVVVNGCAVPFLSAYPRNGGIISLTLDRRFGIDLPVADADRIVSFIADCIAVAMGYTCHPGADHVPEPIRANPFPRMTQIGDFKVEGT